MRAIADILKFRNDISPFLAHLTRKATRWEGLDDYRVPAKDVLRTIIEERALRAGKSPFSDARWGIGLYDLTPEQRTQFFGAISFTETPPSEIHCLLEIERRQVNLEPYGLVFLKDRLSERGVSPVIYLNNQRGDQDVCVRALCTLIESDPPAAEKLLPLVSFFGKQLIPAGRTTAAGTSPMDFRWEREWRCPAAAGPLSFSESDVFVGLCPHEEIEEFQALFPPVAFIDPRRTMQWYATSLVNARQRLDLKSSVV